MCSADNPAACTLGGYKNLHSAFRKCRTCMAVDTDIQEKVRNSEFWIIVFDLCFLLVYT